MPGPILETKLYIPAPRSELVSRSRLLEHLDEGSRSNCKLMLISAPAGFGKTTLVGEWAHHADMLISWLSLDEADNAPSRFWPYLIAALRRTHPGIGEGLHTLFRSGSDCSAEHLVRRLINEMAAFPTPSALILDDLHLVNEPQIHRDLTVLVENLPPQMRIIVSTRADPPWPLARWRARGSLIELRAGDLRFSRDEIAAFMHALELELREETITTLGMRTEGWIAGLQLAALSMRGQDAQQAAAFLRTFSGNHRFILDYLMEEVLNRQPALIQAFLLKTSVLQRLTGALCNAVVDSNAQESNAVLAQIEQANLFLVPLDTERRWYRYHHLFAELLRTRLHRQLPAQVRTLHLRAGEWYESKGFIAEAIRHRLNAGDTERTVHLLEHNILALIEEGEVQSIVRWLDRLPHDAAQDSPWFKVARAWTLANTGQFDLVEPLLQAAEATVADQQTRRHLAGHLAVVRAYVASSTGNLRRAAQCARAALDILPDEHATVRGYLFSLLSVALRWSGDLGGAARASARALALSRTGGDVRVLTSVLCDYAALRIVQGQFKEAAALCREALVLADGYLRQSGGSLPVSGRAHDLLSGVLYAWNDLPEAVYHARQAVALCERWGQPDFLASAYCRLARAQHATGDVAEAMNTIQAARSTAKRVSASYDDHMAAWEAHLWLAQGNTSQALRWAQESGLHIDDTFEFEYLFKYECLARVLITRGEDEPAWLDQAQTLLARLLTMAEEAGAAHLVVRLLVLQAVALTHSRQDGARTALARALDIAEPEGYLRIFLEEREQLGHVLLSVLAPRQRPQPTPREGTGPAYADRLLSALRDETGRAFSQPAPAQTPMWIEPLSKREHEVLHLVAEGLSNREISQSLVITLNTVKNHLKNIYGKLAVHSRTQAVERARRLDLL